MFPRMMNDKIAKVIDSQSDKALAWKLSGAGGGGYLILISEKEIPNAIKVKIRIKDYWI
jgi:galactokinase/mevalonate kinase-like predicted kinase